MLATASKAIDGGTNIIILSDRNVSKDLAPIPAVLACSYVNSGLPKTKKTFYLSVINRICGTKRSTSFCSFYLVLVPVAINPYLVNENYTRTNIENNITRIISADQRHS